MAPQAMNSQSSISASSRSSDGTQGTTTSTLWPPPPMPIPNGNDVMRTDNIMNSVADASTSLFQICVALRQRLLGVAGFRETLQVEEQGADEDTDPVTLLWRTFRRGYPLILLYNALQPADPLVLPQDMREEKKQKLATIHFLRMCINDLHMPSDELFIVNDLYGDDTTGIVKVARVVNRVLDVLVKRGVIENVQPTASDFEQAAQGLKRTQRQHIIAELVKSERTYVKHLEMLHDFKQLVEEKGVIHGDAVHDIFLNLNVLLDFQRRFLIRVEQTNELPEEEQNWGKLFLLYCGAFKVYEPYIANQKKCERTVIAEFSRLREAGGDTQMRQMVESSTALHSFLMKPFQRLTKYPLLLDQLYKKGDLDEDRKRDLLSGMEAATSVLSRTNEAVAVEERLEAVQDLTERVEDWKGHKVIGFGSLLLYGTFTVLKSENLTNGKDGERQYHVYLFDNILLCCKNIDVNKPKNKLSNKSFVDSKGKPKLQLKGRIFMQNVTDLVSLSKPGSYTCQIFWKGDPSIENFIIRFTTDEMMKKWAGQIETQRRKYRERNSAARQSGDSRTGGASGTSVTEFSYMQNQPMPKNPYAEEEEDEDDDGAEAVASMSALPSHSFPSNGFTQSRHGSSTSLRSRSTTGDSSISTQSTTRAQPPRLPAGAMQNPALSLRTRELQQAGGSPGTSNLDSYFSPVTESPTSRTSASSGMYPFPRQQMSPPNGYYEEGQGSSRFTAPAVARGTNGAQTNGYGPLRHPVGRPGYPPGIGMHSSQPPPGPRNRSASSPDIHNGQRVLPKTVGQPPVPEVPVGFQNPNRSQSNSPSLANGMPNRISPQLTRDRQHMAQSDMSPSEYDYTEQHRPGMPNGSSSRTITPVVSRGNTFSPTLSQHTSASFPSAVDRSSTPPAQLKVKVHCPSASQTLTLVVSTTITYQTLKDRIDAKLQRSTNLTLGDSRGSKDGAEKIHVKLKYMDEEDLVSIQSDEDVQTAFETWREQKGEGLGGMGEIELYCQMKDT